MPGGPRPSTKFNQHRENFPSHGVERLRSIGTPLNFAQKGPGGERSYSVPKRVGVIMEAGPPTPIIRLSYQNHRECRFPHPTRGPLKLVLFHRPGTRSHVTSTGHGRCTDYWTRTTVQYKSAPPSRCLLNVIVWNPHPPIQATTLPSATTPETLLHIFHDRNATKTETGTNGGGPSDAWGAAEKYPDEWK